MDNTEKINKMIELKNEISILERSRLEYENMNTKINNAMHKLLEAKNYINVAQLQLDKNYSSKAATGKVEELNKEQIEINNLIQKLKNDILNESINKISAINSQIRTLQNEINKLLLTIPF